MKRGITLALIFALAISVVGCGKASKKDNAQQTDTEIVVQKGDTEDYGELQTIDVDLSEMSKENAYAEAYNIIVSPNAYIGKTIRVSGTFANNVYEEGEGYFPTCVIEDGNEEHYPLSIEFVEKDGEVLPNSGDEFTVTGVFETYDVDGNPYYHLVNAIVR